MKNKQNPCVITELIFMIGGRWKPMLLYNLRSGTKRYSELRELTSGISDRMLSHVLKELENDGLIKRTQYPVVPPKTDYQLTAKGKSLDPILKAMGEWAVKNAKRI